MIPIINKRNSFARPNILMADRVAVRKASKMESRLMYMAFDISVYPDRTSAWQEVEEEFKEVRASGYEPSDGEFRDFVRAAKAAFRMETSLTVAPGIDPKNHVRNPLTLRIKFFTKEARKKESFFEWSMTFGDQGRICAASMWSNGHTTSSLSLESSPSDIRENAAGAEAYGYAPHGT